MSYISFNIGAICDVGNVKEINQDNLLIKIGETHFGEFGLFVIADGMGGLAAGELQAVLLYLPLKNGGKKIYHY